MNYAAYPFAPSSIWKRPLPATTQLQTLANPETAAFQRDCTWWGGESIHLQQAALTDPLATWRYQSRGDLSGFWPFGNANNWAGAVQVQTPANLAAAEAGGDRNVGLFTADGRYYIEGWQYEFDAASGEHRVQVMTVHDLQGPGWPSLVGRTDIASLSTGIRAAGGPLLAGLIRGPEVAALAIEHVIAIILPTDKLKCTASTTVSQHAAQQPLVVSGGAGYVVGDVLPLVGGTGLPAEITVTRVSATGAVQDLWVTHPGAYTVPPDQIIVRTQPVAARAVGAAAARRIAAEKTAGHGCTLQVIYNQRGDFEGARVYPATNVDNSAGWAYSGNIPMGSVWTIPASVDVSALGLATPEAVAYARAIQKYGAIVVDATAPGTQLMALTASDVTAAQFEAIRGARPGDPGWHMPAFAIVARVMSMVRNYAPPPAPLPSVKAPRRA